MSRDFTKVSPSVWQSKKFLGLPSHESRLFYLYVLTGPHQTNAGISKLPLAYASYDLQTDLDGIEKSLEACIRAGLLDHDRDTSEVMISNWLAFNIPTNHKHRLGVARTIERVESEHLRNAAMKALEDVYFDPNNNAPNKRPTASEEQIDGSTGEIISLSPPSAHKSPSQVSRQDFDNILTKRRAKG